MSDRTINLLSAMVRGAPLRLIEQACEDQKTINTGRLSKYAETASDELKDYAHTLRIEYDANRADLSAKDARIAELEAERDAWVERATSLQEKLDVAATPSEDGREEPEVVGYLYRTPTGPYISRADFKGHPRDELMTVAQHSRIVAAKDAEIARLRTQLDNQKALTDQANYHKAQRGQVVDELRAQLAAQQAAVPDECPHLILFDDTEVKPILFAGSGARKGALAKWEQISVQWNAHLFVRIAKNSRNDRYPCATLAAPAAPQQGETDPQRSEVARSERELFKAWNNDIDCPLAGRDTKTGAWMAWQARAALTKAPQQGDGVNWKAVANEQRLVIEGLQARLLADRSAQGEKP